MLFIAPPFAFVLALSCLALGAVGSLFLLKQDAAANWWGNIAAALGSAFGLAASVPVLLSGAGFSLSVATSFPLLSLSLSVDMLSAFFIFVISLISLAASVYALGYTTHFYGKYSLGRLGFFYNAFIAGMLLVVSAHNAIFFLIVWEIMSLSSYFLVVYEHKEQANREAGNLYFIMTRIGTACIALAFILLYTATGSFDFGVIAAHAALIPLGMKNLIFILALVGFGTKAGIIPLHVWLPGAHPAAPTHVSALMSGVMIKTAIYMLIRLFVDIIPGAPLWWGLLILVLGAASSLLGVLYALAENDIKRLLAYSSIENIGIILIGLGAALVFLSAGMVPLALLALVAALFHTVNHAVFKGLLFLGAGSVISKTHTRNMEEYGGLIKLMPYTAFFFLVGAMAISALPPFNGFFSEWATFQTLFAGIQHFGFGAGWAFVLGAGSLAFTGGLAAACFVKAFGVSFLARPRSASAKHAKESSWPLHLGMGFLALLSLLLGLFAAPFALLLSSVGKGIGALSGAVPTFSATAYSFTANAGFATVSMPLLFVSLAAAVLGAWVATLVFARNRKVVLAATWDCGSPLTPRMEITSTGFARSLIMIFRGILKPTQQSGAEYLDAYSRYFPKSHEVELGIADVYDAYLYRPLRRLTLRFAGEVKKIQSGNVNGYILYIFIALAVLITFSLM